MNKVQDQTNSLRVLVADKSSYTRLVLEYILSSEKDISIVGSVSDGDSLVEKLKEEKADLAIVDMDLPKNTRLFTLQRVYSEVPTPILLLVDRNKLSLELIKGALEIGVYGIIIKPGDGNCPNYRDISEELVQKVRQVRDFGSWNDHNRYYRIEQEYRLERDKVLVNVSSNDSIIVIGASTGGIPAIESIVKQLSPDLKATILIAVHLPVGFSQSLIKRLQELTPLKVVEGRSGILLKPGKIIVAPGGQNMVVQSVMGSGSNLKIGFSDEPTAAEDRPSVDLLMKSVAESSIKNIIGIILTGMGKDGTIGASYIKKSGGMLVAQDEASSVIFGMAKSAIEHGFINKIMPLSRIPFFINKYQAPQYEVSLAGAIR